MNCVFIFIPDSLIINAKNLQRSYNPYDGPNDNPEVELPLTAGEYIYVYGDMDDDGFYEGEGFLFLCLGIRRPLHTLHCSEIAEYVQAFFCSNQKWCINKLT